jgi:hypothetical protein
VKAPAIADIGRALRRHPILSLLLAAAAVLAVALLLRGGEDDARSDAADAQFDLFGALQGVTRLSPDDLIPDPPADPRGPHFPLVRVQPDEEVELRDSPGGRVIATLGDETEFHSPQTLWISEIQGDWFGVHAPALPNNELGWIRDDRTLLEISETQFWITANTAAQVLALRYGNRILDSFRVTVGSPGSPTPLGDYSVTDGLAGPGVGPYYGCCVLALTGHQPNLPPNWIGGDRIAIHGTPGTVGGANSAGCLRASDPDMVSLFARVPLGTPVIIR